MDKLTAIKVFMEVAEKGSFTTAAENLNMSKPKVTRCITDLETWLKCRLFNRTTRKISLTVAGEMHLSKARKILELTNDFKQVANKSTQKPSGKIRISTSTAFGETHLAKACVLYLKRYPEVEIELIIDDHCIDLIEKRVDIAIRTHIEADENLIARPISNAKAILCASPDYLNEAPLLTHPNTLQKHKIMICTSFKPFDKWALTKGQEEVKLELKASFYTNDVLVLSRAAVAGGGIVRLPCFLARPLIDQGKLIQVLPNWHIFDLKIWAVYTSREHQPITVRSLIDFLVSYFDEVRKSLKCEEAL